MEATRNQPRTRMAVTTSKLQVRHKPRLRDVSSEAKEMVVLMWCWNWMVQHFADEDRTLTSVKRPMIGHLGAVCFALLNARTPFVVQLASLLHDVFEGYGSVPGEEVRETMKRKLTKWELEFISGAEDYPEEKREQVIENLFTEVLSLVEGVSEDRSEPNWWRRKAQCLKNVRLGGRNLASLSCATKLDGLMRAVNVHHNGGDIHQWSSSPAEMNVRFFRAMYREYVKKGVPEILLHSFRHHLVVYAGLTGNSELLDI